MRYASALLIVISLLVSSGCVRDRSPELLRAEVETLEKQLDEANRTYSVLIEERGKTEYDLQEKARLAKRAAELLEERKRLEEELALARIELERSDSKGVAGDTTGKIRRTDAGTEAGDLSRGATPGYADVPTELPFTPSAEELHVVSRGECLSGIAGYKEYYDDQNLWPYIYAYNADQIRDPHWIFEGQQLLIPLE
jgi:nucleoid-associated protein YgaU